MNQEDKSKVDNLINSLYSRNTPDIRSNRHLRFKDEDVKVDSDWQHESENLLQPNTQNYKDKTMSFFTKILITSIIFFFIALGIGSYLVFNGSNIVSANNVDIIVNGPVSVSGGSPVNFDVSILNHNNIKLQDISFSVDYPSGTVDANDSTKELKNFKEDIGDIEPGGLEQKSIQAIFYGEENSKKTVVLSIKYHVQGSNSPFTKEKTIDLLISSSPINLSISSFKEINSEQEFEISATLQSNSKEVLKNILLKASYPFGFTFISSDLKPITSDNSLWRIGDIPPGGKKVVKIKGKLEAQNDEIRNFRFSAGSPRISSDKSIGTEYTSDTQEISIKKPFVTLGISLNGDSESREYSATFNNSVNIDINYSNNLPTSIIDGEIRVKISGNAYDKFSVNPLDGLYNSTNNEIVWNSITSTYLRNIEAGGNGRVSFNITPKDLSVGSKKITNPSIKFVVSVQAKRNSETNVPEKVAITASREIKVSSNALIGGQILHNSGSFANTGPIPPRADQQTTYTVVWTVDNTANNISNVQVLSSLPPYVKWLNKISPSSEDITYDNVTGQIAWNVGSVGTYTSGSTKRKQVSFQISLNPTINQINQSPVLVNTSILTATDDFTGQSLKSNLGTLNTRFTTESSFREGDDKVVK